MDSNRLFKIVLTDLSVDNLKHQEDLELIINSPIEINNKVKKIKKILSKIVNNEAMITKFTTFVSGTQKTNE